MSIRQETGAPTLLGSAQFSALGNGTGATASAYDNGASANLWIKADFQFSGVMAATPNSGSALDLYLLPSIDGTNFADGNSAIFPPSLYVGSFIVRNVTTNQVLVLTGVPIPPTKIMPLLVNKAGAAISANTTASTLTIFPSRYQ